MEAFQLPAIIILLVILAIAWVELSGRGKTIDRQAEWVKKARKKIQEQKDIILQKNKVLVEQDQRIKNQKDHLTEFIKNQHKFSQWMNKEQIMELKGWSESQFNTMMWALKKEGYAQAKGKSSDRLYSIIEKNK